MMRLPIRAVLLVFVIGTSSVWAQKCRVQDPELQGAYSGGCKDGLADGIGTATGIAEYRGPFLSGKKHGKGIKIWPWGDRYEGDFVEDRKEGQGIYSWSPTGPWAGERYVGPYRDDSRNGTGTYYWPTGEMYSGQWKNDQIDGPVEPRLFDRFRAHARADTEARIAVAKVGTKVCRAVSLGISEREWVRGVVVDVQDLHIAVRVEDPGRYAQSLNGTNLVRGALVWDDAPRWTPCL